MKATWNNMLLAKSDKNIVVEGNHSLPPESVRSEHLKQSRKHTACPWKREASYYDVQVDGRVNRDAAWYYPSPNPAASQIKDYVAFWRGVRVSA